MKDGWKGSPWERRRLKDPITSPELQSPEIVLKAVQVPRRAISEAMKVRVWEKFFPNHFLALGVVMLSASLANIFTIVGTFAGFSQVKTVQNTVLELTEQDSKQCDDLFRHVMLTVDVGFGADGHSLGHVLPHGHLKIH